MFIKSKQENQAKNVIQGQRPDTENIHNKEHKIFKIIRTKQQK